MKWNNDKIMIFRYNIYKIMVIFVKSYPKDFSRLDVLLRSIEDYNIDNIPVYIYILYNTNI